MSAKRTYLFVTFEGGGNVPPMLGLARCLVARGHHVRVLTEPCLAAAVEGIGGEFTAFTRHFTRQERTEDLIRDSEARTPLGALHGTFRRVLFGPATVVAEETGRAIEAERPDVVVADLMMPGALVAAEAAGIPRVVVFHTPEYLPGPGRPAAGPGFLPRTDLPGRLRDGLTTRIFLHLLGRHVGSFDEARRTFGLPALRTAKALLAQYHQADLRLIQTTEAFDFPITPAPANVRYVGPMLDDPDWAGAWKDPWSEPDSRPLVVVSLSSTFQNQRPLLQRIIDAMGGLEVRALVTLGPSMASERFELSGNVAAVPSAPHNEVFPRAAVVVTHAGHGTVIRALAHGLPLVCIPMGRDQNDNAARVVARGLGTRLGPTASASRIAAATGSVLMNPEYRARAEALGRIVRQDVSEDRGTAALEGVGI